VKQASLLEQSFRIWPKQGGAEEVNKRSFENDVKFVFSHIFEKIYLDTTWWLPA
jgi:hypothetical protein